MHIFVRSFDDAGFRLVVEGTETVAVVKAKIQEVKGIPPEQQVLLFAGDILSEDDHTLDDRFVQPESTLFLVRQLPQEIQIDVEIEKAEYRLVVRLSDTFEEIKQKFAITSDKEIDPTEYKLMFGGKVLEDARKLSDADIEEFFKLHLVRTIK
ncbi:polyubiquitin-like [Uranotaenia lowii]|uniref:polyubiquitin-like n=1 Tax=Uranotaenia lowii TaxID=190385 RepID=UPI00247A50A8|nr:polyubiquitin-like [Uranotaenia lowii]